MNNQLNVLKYILEKYNLNIEYNYKFGIIYKIIREEKNDFLELIINHLTIKNEYFILNETITHYLNTRSKKSIVLYKIAVKHLGYQKAFEFILNKKLIILINLTELLPYLIENGCDVELINNDEIKIKLHVLLRKNKFKKLYEDRT